MTRLIDADALKESIDEHVYLVHHGFNETEYGCTQYGMHQIIDEQPTIDAVPLDGSFLKMSKGDYLIYNRHWLYEHFDMEVDIQRSAMKSMGYEPAIKDAEPVRHGKWIPKILKFGGRDYVAGMKCSACGEDALETEGDEYLTDYCPNCGCRMDADRREE